MRRDLESLKERLSALERHIEETDGVLTEAQVCVLEKKQDDEWLLARLKRLILAIWVSDTFYAGTISALAASISRPSSIPATSTTGCGQLYTTKTPITGADLLNNRVLPFFRTGMDLIRI